MCDVGCYLLALDPKFIKILSNEKLQELRDEQENQEIDD